MAKKALGLKGYSVLLALFAHNRVIAAQRRWLRQNMKRDFYTTDVFTSTPFAGNPLAVVGDAGGLDAACMQTLAREFNLSETVFLCPPKSDDSLASLRIFTVQRELPFAGHPTVGAALLIAELAGMDPSPEAPVDFALDLEVGRTPVRIERASDGDLKATFTTPRQPVWQDEAPAASELAALLGLPVEALDLAGAGLYSAGTPFFVVGLKDRAALAACRFDAAVAERLGVMDLYAVAPDPDGLAQRLHCRMFAPLMGIPEDPATGSAAACVPAYLAKRAPEARGWHALELCQGADMGRPSLIHLGFQQDRGVVTKVTIGGQAQRISEGQVLVPQ